MNQLHTPLFDAMSNLYKKGPISLHVPGHKNGQVFNEKGRALYKPLLGIDATEISGLDDLHAPEGVILEAERLLADLYGVQKSYFLVNGTTVGNLAMILAACGEGDKVLVQRNCHKSILHGLMLANVRPVFLQPIFYREWEVAGGISSDLLGEALDVHSDAKAVILTNPNYYGLAEKGLSGLVKMAHERGIPVLVDEAHGAHFQLGSLFPDSAILAGADAVVHSAHKTLPAMTMGSYLHIHSDLLDLDKMTFYLQMLQSSSPSYPIMGSLDLARGYLASFTIEDQNQLIKRISDFRGELGKLGAIRVLEAPLGTSADPLKVVIQSTTGLSGFQLQKLFEGENLYPELADPYNLLMTLPLVKEEQDFPFKEIIKKIERASSAMKDRSGEQDEEVVPQSALGKNAMTGLAYPYSVMKQKSTVQVEFGKAIGAVSAEMVIPYPPGIPLIMTGEMITSEHIDNLGRLLALDSRFHGGSFLSGGKLIVYEGSQVG